MGFLMLDTLSYAADGRGDKQLALEFVDVDRVGLDVRWGNRFLHREIVDLDSVGCGEFAAFFREIATDPVWDGDRTWSADDGIVYMTARRGGKGLVGVHVTLSANHSVDPFRDRPEWTSTTVFLLRSTELSRIAEDAEAFAASPRPARRLVPPSGNPHVPSEHGQFWVDVPGAGAPGSRTRDDEEIGDGREQPSDRDDV